MTSPARIERLEDQYGDLLTAHRARTHSLRSFTRYADDPGGFCEGVLGGKPWSAQRSIMDTVRRHALTAVQSGNACGKDWTAAVLALWWVYARRGFCLLTGPTERQTREILMGEIGRLWRRAEDLPGELYSLALRVPGDDGAAILAFTSTDASRLTGFHAARVLAILTEAQGCEPFAYEAMLACAVGAEDRVLAVGNPLSPTGKFYDITRPTSAWQRITVSCLAHPNLTGTEPAIPGGPTPQFVERIAAEYGRGSGIYGSRVLGQFPQESESGLIRRSWLEAAAERWKTAPPLHPDTPTLLAVDPARYGTDETAVCVWRGDRLVTLVTWHGADTMETVARLRVIGDQYGVTPHQEFGSVNRFISARGRIVCDTIGVGAGVADRLREARYKVTDFNAGSKPTWQPPGLLFANRRAASFWMLRRRLEEGTMALPEDAKLWDELVTIRWSVNSTGKIQLEAKDELRERLGRSPDRADAVAMAVEAVTHEVPKAFSFTL